MSNDNSSYQDAVKSITEQLSETSKKLIEASGIQAAAFSMVSEAMKPLIERQDELLSGVREAISQFQISLPKIDFQFPKIEIPEGLKRLVKNAKYLRFLEEIQWPLFLERDERLQDALSQYVSADGDYPFDEIREIIFEYYTDDVIDTICSSWEEFLSGDEARLAILKEAIQLHKKGYYHASTALLMSQVNGIITKTDEIIELNNYQIKEEDLQALCEYYKVTYETWKNHVNRSERSQVLKMIAVTENGFRYWDAVTKYVRDIVLKNYGDDELANRNPMRNKILHGVQLNYGTKEHSLKSILTVDLLMQYYEEIKTIIEKHLQNDENTEQNGEELD